MLWVCREGCRSQFNYNIRTKNERECVCGVGGGGGGGGRNRGWEERGTEGGGESQKFGEVLQLIPVQKTFWSTEGKRLTVYTHAKVTQLIPIHKTFWSTTAIGLRVEWCGRTVGGDTEWRQSHPAHHPTQWSQRDEASVYLSVWPEWKQAYWSQDVPARHWQIPSETTLIRLTLGRHFKCFWERDKVVRLHYTQKIHVSVTGNRAVFRWTHGIHLLTWAIW